MTAPVASDVLLRSVFADLQADLIIQVNWIPQRIPSNRVLKALSVRCAITQMSP
jgi:hypothetical protein